MQNETNLNDLYDFTVEAFPRTTKRQFATSPIKITKLTWTPFVGMKTLFIKAIAQNEGREYNPIILFKKVVFDAPDGISITASDGLEYHLQPIADNDVLVRCNCGDHFWRFRHYNYLDKSLYGSDRKPYEAKFYPGSANPLKLPGLCKHILKLIEVLKQAHLIK